MTRQCLANAVTGRLEIRVNPLVRLHDLSGAGEASTVLGVYTAEHDGFTRRYSEAHCEGCNPTLEAHPQTSANTPPWSLLRTSEYSGREPPLHSLSSPSIPSLRSADPDPATIMTVARAARNVTLSLLIKFLSASICLLALIVRGHINREGQT
jgi:hypothetical protein